MLTKPSITEKKKEERHLCFRCGRKRSPSKLVGCECGKTHWCKDGCCMTQSKQWKKWNVHGFHGDIKVVI